MLVTIFTDAGLCPETGIGTWAVWCKSERGVSRAGGVLREPQAFSTMAESAAAVNGIHHAIASGVAMTGDTLLVQTDNNDVGRFLTFPIGKHLKHIETRRAMQARYLSVVQKYGLRISFRHVKGHQGTRNKRSAVNTWCDRVCTFFLRMARHEHDPIRWKAPETVPYGVEMRDGM